MSVTVVLSVGLVEALRVNEADPVQVRVHRRRAVCLIWHQSVVAVTHPAIHLHAHIQDRTEKSEKRLKMSEVLGLSVQRMSKCGPTGNINS